MTGIRSLRFVPGQHLHQEVLCGPFTLVGKPASDDLVKALTSCGDGEPLHLGDEFEDLASLLVGGDIREHHFDQGAQNESVCGGLDERGAGDDLNAGFFHDLISLVVVDRDSIMPAIGSCDESRWR